MSNRFDKQFPTAGDPLLSDYLRVGEGFVGVLEIYSPKADGTQWIHSDTTAYDLGIDKR
jgi:hypothetical protein